METTLDKRSLFKISEKAKKLIIDFVTYIFVFLFIYTASSKILTFQLFKEVLSMSPLIGGYYKILSWLIPFIEIVISVSLIIQKTRKIGLLASLGIMIVFTGYLIYMVSSGSTLPCHCGGVISIMSWKQHIWFNLVFTALAGIGYNATLNMNRLGSPGRVQVSRGTN